MQRLIAAFASAMLFAPAALGDAGLASIERDTYRSAETYQSLRATSAESCAASCAADGRCMSWSMTPPTFRVGPRCEMKSSVGQSYPRPGHVSGLSPRAMNGERPVASVAIPTQPPAARATASYQVQRPASVQSAPVRTVGSTTPNQPQTFAAPAPRTPLAPTTDPTTAALNKASLSVMESRYPVGRQAPPPATAQRTVTYNQPSPQPAQTQTVRTVSSSPARLTPQQGSSSQQTVSAAPVAEAPPPLIARPASEPTGSYVTKRTVTPASATPSQRPTPRPQPTPTPAVTAPTPGTRPLPTRATRPQLPKRPDRPVSNYSVQNMGEFPGDYDAMSGFVDGLPENAEVIPIERDETDKEDDKKRSSSGKNKGSDSDDWPDEYPDPLGAYLGDD
ncbi:PAN domain-containing protein [Henriciella litoralis]|uniref:PAN domain-containing protein n=1 Tax=Henriciella litoralis TaxID=568102 RepID=UPI0009FF89A3|nr:PAN domain-containing protein [Henriciella litoralis]